MPPASGSQDFSTDIAFAGGSRSLPGDAMPALSAIADRMKSNPGLQARVSGAAAAGDPGEARDVALARALAVQRYPPEPWRDERCDQSAACHRWAGPRWRVRHARRPCVRLTRMQWSFCKQSA